jgi:hypothetical protein
MTMRKILGVLTVLTAAVLLAGCLEVRQDYTLNPDGSGKLVVDLTAQEAPLNIGQAETPDPEVMAKQTVRRMLDGSKGVDAWADVAYNRTEDGRVHIKCTAYFKDLAKTQLATVGSLVVTFAKDDKGGMTLLIANAPEAAKAAPASAPKLTPEEIDQRVKMQREQFQQMRPMMEMFLGKARVEMSFRLPGTVGEVSNLQKEQGGVLRFVLEGAKALQVIDQLMADDAYVRERVAAGAVVGRGGAQLNDALNEKLFGSRGPLQARVTGDLKPLFDYAAEAKAAKDAYPKMLERLGMAPAPSAPAVTESGGKSPIPPPAAGKEPAK